MPHRYVDRPPRIEPELPSGVFSIPNPPDVEEHPNDILAQAFLPLIMVIGYIVVALMGQGRNLLVMIPMVLSIVASVGLVFYTRSREAKQRKELSNMYMRRLSELRRKMESEHQQQSIYFYYNYPNPETTLGIARDIDRAPQDRQEEIRSGTRLWERRPTDHDFMHLRLGISTRPSTVIYKASDTEKTNSPLTQEALRLAGDSQMIRGVPVTVPVFQPGGDNEKREKTPESKQPDDSEHADRPTSQVRHSIGITGPRDAVYAYTRTMLVDYATFHSPEDTQLYIAGTTSAEKSWVWAFALPHCQKSDHSQTIKFEKAEKPGENEQDQMRLYWKELRTILERRRMRLQDKEDDASIRLPFLLVVVDVLEGAPEWSCLKDLEAEAAISTILMDGQTLGAAVLFLCPDRTKVPSRCTAVVEVDPDPIERNTAIFRYAETGFSTIRYVGTTTLVPTFEAAREFTNHLAPLEIRRGYGSSLASTVTLLEMLHANSIEDLREMAQDNWRRSKVPEQADWLQTAVGLLSGNEPRVLNFSAKADGVHGIIAGSTGSGKSELLMTLILGLALNYDPSVLNFVLIDYKGGTAFEPFQRLPHKVDIVTNLDESATARVFASINAELNRRQEINKNSQSKDIVHYRAKGLSLDPERPPYPHLFIIIDEFAEMIAANAEFKAQLESITRLGRALGVTLILAAQRPTGVTDQMRANIKFRICLRVETPDDSREVLRRNDAAFLPPGIPGRGYLQIGNENIEMIQTAYTGGDYTGEEDKNAIPNVIWVDRPKRSAMQKSGEAPKLYDVIVDMLANLSTQESKPQWRPWPEFLPRQDKQYFSLETPLDTAYIDDPDVELLRMFDDSTTALMSLNEKARSIAKDDFQWSGIRWGYNAMRPLVGIIDNPHRAFQKPLMVNFPNGHAAVFGASGRGKTTFLRTVISSLALSHSPDELHIYILDFGGRALSIFRDLPHVGAIITAEEEERVLRLLRRISDIIDQRQVEFSEANVNSLDAYNLAHPEKPFPAVLVVIDNFAEFREYYDGLMSPLISLVREARSFGVHFLFSADVPGALTNKLFNLVTERMTLKLSDTGEYGTVVGRGVPADLSNVPGRGYVRVENLPLEFQTALSFTPEENETHDMSKIKRMVETMKRVWADGWKGKRPSTIEILQPRVSLEKLIQEAGAPQKKVVTALLGIDDRNLQPLWLDLERQGPHMIVVGQPLTGKTTTLRTILLSMAYHFSPQDFAAVLVDLSGKLWRGSNCSLAELPHVIQTISDLDELDLFLANLTAECKFIDAHPRQKHRKILILIDNYDTFSDEGNRKNMAFFEGMGALVRKYQTAGVWIVAAGSLNITSAADDLRKIITGPSFGIALKSADAVNRLNGKFPRSLADQELPMGRAFSIRSGITTMLQTATPYSNDSQPGDDIDCWVERIQQRHAGGKARWAAPVKNVPPAAPPPVQPARVEPVRPAGTPAGDGQEADGADILSEPALKPLPKPVEEYDLEAIKQKLLAEGMPDFLLNTLDPEGIIRMAYDKGLIQDEASK